MSSWPTRNAYILTLNGATGLNISGRRRRSSVLRGVRKGDDDEDEDDDEFSSEDEGAEDPTKKSYPVYTPNPTTAPALPTTATYSMINSMSIIPGYLPPSLDYGSINPTPPGSQMCFLYLYDQSFLSGSSILPLFSSFLTFCTSATLYLILYISPYHPPYAPGIPYRFTP